ncbi:stalk domain-containing protein [Chengkuizengella axinellae]|uniref:Thioredoxin domain-containing protein n=1 Tax=Chengkuizengella axinellae TaxID=3064388 RepID=A0ABT9J632_9BACL|nr:thioredoxin domain-containing protein [Chengkuizengella sp. 2205SS18-9]MDP5276465.1 thioredoxin domain-containing protein [Chengkuizengella sp. 2205SS18-9]
MKKTLFITGLFILLFSVTVFAASEFKMIVNGTQVDVELKVIDGATYVPLRAVGEMLGADVIYDGTTKTITINDEGQTTSEYAKYEEDAKRLYQTSPKDLKPETRELLMDVNYQSIILPDQFEEKIDNEESFFVYFFSPACHHCIYTTPLLNPIAEEVGVELFQYNVYEFEQGWEYVNSTPTIIYFENGQQKDLISGGITNDVVANQYKEFLMNNK